jgi:multidrug efflux pump subunit AcrA (membrane-fusion protein)
MALSKKMRRYRGWIAAAVLVAVAASAYLMLRGSSDEETAVSYTTEAASIGTISVTISGTGNLEIGDTTEVWPDHAGTVASIEVEEGSEVSTGTVLYMLDASDLEDATAKAYSSYLQAKQSVLNAESQLIKAEAELDDVTERSELPTPTATSDDVEVAEKSVESAEIGLTSAKTNLTSAYNDYKDAQAAEGDLEVVAPCSGTVSELNIEVGDSVASSSGGSSGSTATGTTSTTSSSAPVVLTESDTLRVKLTVNEVDLPELELGQRADVEFDAFPDLTATGKVVEISDEGTNNQGVVTFDVYIALDVADDALRPAMSAAATIVTDVAKDALLVPNAAVQSDGDDGNPAKVTVEVGLMSATQTQVLAGIAEGDMVVTATLDGETESDTSGGFMMPGTGMGGGPRG